MGDVLGVGGMAVVYRAQHRSLKLEAALKVMNHEVSGEPMFRERFRRESQYVAALVHPHIVPVYAFGEDAGCLFLAMRLVHGQTLAERARGRPLDPVRAIRLLGGIADALDVAHIRGLVHRDVKPHNILLASDGHPYLADFGVAKDAHASDLTVGGGFLGTPNFAAPEQIRGGPITPATDVYGLAAVLYYCLTGEAPHRRPTDPVALSKQVRQSPRPLPSHIPHASNLNRVLARGMAAAPKRRYGRAGELIQAAQASMDPRSRPPTSRRRPAARPTRISLAQSRRGMIVFGGALMLFVLPLAVAVISALWLHRR